MVLPIGKKAVEYFRQRGIECLTDKFAEIADISVADCFEIANLLCEEFRKGTFGHIELCYTSFSIHAFSAAGGIFCTSYD